MPHRSRRTAGLAIAATAAVLAVPLASPAFAASPEGDPAPLNGYRSVGYVMADSPQTRDFQISDIITSGAIDDLTHINYAFGNVTSDLVCDIADGRDANAEHEGDAYDDYLRTVDAADSVDGVADTDDQPLAGNFNQLRKLKEKHPETKILISLGGWAWSDNFSEAVATEKSRQNLVDSCIDIYLKGNLPVYGDRGGDAVAEGIFDGIDIDWEWPVTGGETQNAAPEDEENFLALMSQFRQSLDEYGESTGEDYILSAFAPVGAWNTQGGWYDQSLFDSVDFLNVQGYDYTGSWVPNVAGHQGNLYPDGDHNDQLALAPELQEYVDAGARPDQLNAGLAAYGQGWEGVEDGTQAWQEADDHIGTKTYAELRTVGTEYFDPESGAAWRFQEATDDEPSQWWSLDTPSSVTAKANYVAEKGYGGAMWWDLSGDYRNELGSTLGQVLRNAESGPLADGSGSDEGSGSEDGDDSDAGDESDGDSDSGDDQSGAEDGAESDGDEGAGNSDAGSSDVGNDGADSSDADPAEVSPEEDGTPDDSGAADDADAAPVRDADGTLPYTGPESPMQLLLGGFVVALAGAVVSLVAARRSRSHRR